MKLSENFWHKAILNSSSLVQDSIANLNEVLNFKVIDFSKENKKILVSHTATFKEGMIEEKKKKAASTKSAVQKLQASQQQSTLGDLDSLNALKDDLEKNKN